MKRQNLKYVHLLNNDIVWITQCSYFFIGTKSNKAVNVTEESFGSLCDFLKTKIAEGEK